MEVEICQLQAGDPGKLWYNSTQVQRPEIRSYEAEKDHVPPQAWKVKFFLSAFWALKGLDDAHYIEWGGQVTLLDPWIQMLISSGNTLIDTCRNNICQIYEHPFELAKVTCKVNHHTKPPELSCLITRSPWSTFCPHTIPSASVSGPIFWYYIAREIHSQQGWSVAD